VSVEALAIVLHHSRAKGTAKLVLVGVANHEGDGGAWPTVATLARYANVDVRNAQRALVKLQELGELEVEAQAGGMAGTADCDRPNLYRVRVRCPVWCDGTTQHRDQRKLAGHQVGWRPGPQGVAIAPPPGGIATPPGGGSATPPGGADATRTRPTNHPNNSGGAATVTTGDSPTAQLQAAAAALPTCWVCSKPAARCLAIPERRSGHRYTEPPRAQQAQ
jgi:hypothetical protein